MYAEVICGDSYFKEKQTNNETSTKKQRNVKYWTGS